MVGYLERYHVSEFVPKSATPIELTRGSRRRAIHRDHLAKAHGVRVPIVPGIVPILSGSQIKRFTALCGAKIPAPLHAKLDELGSDDAAVAEFGIEYATRQCEELLREGAPGVHFYTLNKARSTAQVLKNLRLA